MILEVTIPKWVPGVVAQGMLKYCRGPGDHDKGKTKLIPGGRKGKRVDLYDRNVCVPPFSPASHTASHLIKFM
jgi:hypothetical protein